MTISATCSRRRSMPGCLSAIFLVLGGSMAVAQTIGPVLHVKADAAGANNGSCWQDAFTRLEEALDAAYYAQGTVTQIWVAGAVYKPDGGMGSRAAAFVLVDGVSLYGGFAGHETSLTQRNPATNITILSGDIGTPGVITDNCYSVVVGFDMISSPVLDGFTIRDGNAGHNTSYLEGGGVLIYDGSPTIRNCRIINNAANRGGGLYCNGAALITGCTFENNSATTLGGGAYLENGARLVDCRLTGNSAGSGGGVHAEADSSVSQCTIDGNTAAVGAGVHALASTVANCKITGNLSVQSSPMALSYGGGIYADGSTICNCLIALNRVMRFSGTGHGGGIACDNAGVTIRNCTIADNNPGGVSTVRLASPPVISSSIIWGNTGGAVTREAPTDGAAAPICYSDFDTVEGTWTGAGNINDLPHLSADYHLQPGSPCIDAGDPAYAAAKQEADLDLEYRVAGGRVDIGSDESNSPRIADINLDRKVNIFDLQRMALSWNKIQGQTGYDPACDLSGDNRVNIFDLQILAKYWNR